MGGYICAAMGFSFTVSVVTGDAPGNYLTERIVYANVCANFLL
jgi:putative lipase involved disintegration of autophagic bodies